MGETKKKQEPRGPPCAKNNGVSQKQYTWKKKNGGGFLNATQESIESEFNGIPNKKLGFTQEET